MIDPTLARRGLLRLGAASVAGAAAAHPWTSASAAEPGASRVHRAADLVLFGGQVITMQRGFRVTEAIAIRNGRVMRVGSNRSMRRLIGRRTEVVNLHGRTALPGINDSHVHGVRTGLSLPPYNLDLGAPSIDSIADIAALVAETAATLPPGAWIRGKGWNQELFSEGRAPTRQDLDAVAPDNPVALTDWSNHQLWVNTRALEIAGITGSTQPPPGGVIVKDAAGNPTGLFFETAMALITSHIPAFTKAEQADALEKNISLLLSFGITSYTEPGMGQVAREIYEEKAAAGALRVRVTGLLSRSIDTYPVSADEVREILDGYQPADVDPRWFNVTGVKLRADGVPISSKTAWMRRPYVGGGRGGLVIVGSSDEEKVAEFTEMVALVHRAGLQVGTHATGDAAIDAVAMAYAAARRRYGHGNQRHYVIHGDFTRPSALRLLAENGYGVNMNPNIKHLIADSQPAVVGPHRAAMQSPYANALAAGVRVTSASDSPNVEPDWRQGLETMLLREGVSGKVSGRRQRIGLRAALRTYTTTGAWQDHAEDWKGALAHGKVADICVLDGRLLDARDRLGVDAHQISDLPVRWTFVNGEVAYDAESAASGTGAVQPASWSSRPSPNGMCAHC